MSFSDRLWSEIAALMEKEDLMSDSRLHNSRFMKAVRCEPTDTTPVWIMRQAGRYLPEYMEVRSRVKSVLELCRRSDLAAEVTVTAQQVLGVDAAILFADLPPLLIPMGFNLTYEPGPTIHNPLRLGDNLDRVRAIESAEEMGEVLETARLVRSQLADDIPLIGLLRCPVHTRFVCHRGRRIKGLQTHQDADVRRSRCVGGVHGACGRECGHLSEGTGCSWLSGRAVVRQLGRVSVAERLSAVRDAITRNGSFKRSRVKSR